MAGNPRRVPTVRYRQVEGTCYLAQRYRCFEVGPVGWRIWQLCDGVTPVPAIVSALLAEFEGVTSEQALADCEAFLETLTREGLLSWE